MPDLKIVVESQTRLLGNSTHAQAFVFGALSEAYFQGAIQTTYRLLIGFLQARHTGFRQKPDNPSPVPAINQITTLFDLGHHIFFKTCILFI